MKKFGLLILGYFLSSLPVRKAAPLLHARAGNTRAEVAPDSLYKPSFLQKAIDYFGEANRGKRDKAFDFNLIGGPLYSSDTKQEVGSVAAGLYRSAGSDTLKPPSDVSLYPDIATSGFYLPGIRGNHLFPEDRYRLTCHPYFFPLRAVSGVSAAKTAATIPIKATGGNSKNG